MALPEGARWERFTYRNMGTYNQDTGIFLGTYGDHDLWVQPTGDGCFTTVSCYWEGGNSMSWSGDRESLLASPADPLKVAYQLAIQRGLKPIQSTGE